ncbi:hypothetical protein HUJ05_003158 [Dendroctonus ponderosae]|nr:hypothetical protein HUJ05_003158 [Dendroctonus ponderosae]
MLSTRLAVSLTTSESSGSSDTRKKDDPGVRERLENADSHWKRRKCDTHITIDEDKYITAYHRDSHSARHYLICVIVVGSIEFQGKNSQSWKK